MARVRRDNDQRYALKVDSHWQKSDSGIHTDPNVGID